MTLSTNSPWLPVLLAVGDEEILERHLAPLVAVPQDDRRAERDQRRRRVADRRAIGDVAADRARVADLLAGDAVPELAQLREAPDDRAVRLGVGDARAERQRAVGLARSGAAPARWPMKISGPMSRMNFVTQRPTSVAPVTIVASGLAA